MIQTFILGSLPKRLLPWCSEERDETKSEPRKRATPNVNQGRGIS
jgi:hypothetical protein